MPNFEKATSELFRKFSFRTTTIKNLQNAGRFARHVREQTRFLNKSIGFREKGQSFGRSLKTFFNSIEF
jgi:hypothetical protein